MTRNGVGAGGGAGAGGPGLAVTAPQGERRENPDRGAAAVTEHGPGNRPSRQVGLNLIQRVGVTVG